MVSSRRCLSPHSIYCLVSTPTGPRPLSADRIVIFLFRLSWRSMSRCSLDRLDVVLHGMNARSIPCAKCCMRVSISHGGSGARHVDVPRSELGS